jgi:S1-C subfamily serine protease
MRRIIISIFIIVFYNTLALAQNSIELNSELMNSTFKIQGLDGSLGTAFIIGKPLEDNPSRARCVLVTANHVLEGMKGDYAIIHLRQKSNDTYIKLEYKFQIRSKGKNIWTKHDNADVAVMYITLPNSINLKLLGSNIFGTDNIYKKIEIHPGDEFYCLGYTLGQESNKYGFPIARKGIIASYPLTPNKDVGNILLDIKIFKGNSGGPVYFAQSGRTYKGSLHAETTQFIAGLISKERLNITQSNSAYKSSVEAQQLDLAEVVPAVFIIETINKLP